MLGLYSVCHIFLNLDLCLQKEELRELKVWKNFISIFLTKKQLPQKKLKNWSYLEGGKTTEIFLNFFFCRVLTKIFI